MSSNRQIFVNDLILPCLIGIHAHEKKITQRLRININLRIVDDNCSIQDDIKNVINYETLIDGVRKLTNGKHINLVETLADDIMKMCLSDERVLSSKVSVEKLDVYDEVGSVGVEIECMRDGF